MKVALDISPLNSAHKTRGIGTYTKNLLNGLLKSKTNVATFNKNFDDVEADIFHFPYFDFYFRSLKLKNNSKNIVTVHDVIPLVFPDKFPSGIRGKLNLFSQKNKLKKADAIICDSINSKKDINAYLKITNDKIYNIHLAPSSVFQKLSDERLKKINKKLNLPEDFFLYVGDLNWNKNVENLLYAVNIAKVNLVMVGAAFENKNLKELQQIRALIKKLKIENKIKILGFISDSELGGVYNLAKATILPSFYEGFGLPVLESMACQTPVICSNNSSLLEICSKETFFCNPHSPEDIAKNIEKVNDLKSSEKEQLAEKLKDHAAKFTWNKTIEETIKVYKKIYDN